MVEFDLGGHVCATLIFLVLYAFLTALRLQCQV